MNVPNDELDQMAESALRVNKNAMDALAALQRGDTQAAVNMVSEVQRLNWLLRRRLLAAGAVNSITGATHTAAGNALGETHSTAALDLLSSDASKQFALALRDAAIACRQMETERGILGDGITEQYEIAADAAELEVFGPKELR